MRVTILNGNPEPSNTPFDSCLAALAGNLERGGHTVNLIPLRERSIKQCSGCFDCWLKTPGRCAQKDDYEEILQAFVKDDLMVFASPLSMGFTSSLLKRATERVIPVLLPYIDASSGECRHDLRYGRSPRLGVLYEPEPDTDPEDLEILELLWRRLCRNAQTDLLFVHSVREDLKEVARALDRL